MAKWFETWNDVQRRDAIEEILALSKPKQLLHAREILDKVSPLYHIDFTRMLPRVICLYIMSFLDPRSLSRCSQVNFGKTFLQRYYINFIKKSKRCPGIGRCFQSQINFGYQSVHASVGI